MSPGLLDPTSILIDVQHELEMGWETPYYQLMESIGDSDDDPLVHYAFLMLSDEPFTQLMKSAYYQTIYETGGPSSFPAMGSAYVSGGSTPHGDPYATQSSYYGQGSVMFSGVGD